MQTQFSFKAKMRIRKSDAAPASWHFISVPKKLSAQLRDARIGKSKHWFWEIKVEVRVWPVKRQTLLMWSKKWEEFLFPIKAVIRKQLNIVDWDELHIDMSLI